MKNLFFRSVLKTFVFAAVFSVFTLVFAVDPAPAQKRTDHFTEQETELIRDAQEIDRRMEVFIKAIERRFLVLEKKASTLTKKEQKALEKDSEKWGDLPSSTETKLLSDIENILDEAITNLDDAAKRDHQSKLFPKAVHTLADAAREFIPKLRAFYEKAPVERERAVALQAIEFCNMIVEASTKIEKPVDKKQKKDKN